MRSGTYLLSICENGAIWRPPCIPHLQFVETDIEWTFEGIGVIRANRFGQIFASVLVGR